MAFMLERASYTYTNTHTHTHTRAHTRAHTHSHTVVAQILWTTGLATLSLRAVTLQDPSWSFVLLTAHCANLFTVCHNMHEEKHLTQFIAILMNSLHQTGGIIFVFEF